MSAYGGCLKKLTDLTAIGESGPAPVAALNAPAAHALHATPSAVALYPTAHVQSVAELLPRVWGLGSGLRVAGLGFGRVEG